jgi:nitronate monooxygenase
VSSFADFAASLRIPLIAAPMTFASGYDLVAAATAAGIAGSFPVHNAASLDELDRWLTELSARDGSFGPVVPNILVNKGNERRRQELDAVIAHGVPAVITSVGSPVDVIGPLHEAGILVLADVASVHHAERAIALGVDGLVLLAAGAGGQTGFANPFAFIRAVRRVWDGPTVLAGGIVDGQSLYAARVAGYDLGYMGTAFLATNEAEVGDDWKQAVVGASLDDIRSTTELTGLPTNVIGESAFGAGHSVVAMDRVLPAAELVERTVREYDAARRPA